MGADPIAVRDFAQAAETLGYAHITAPVPVEAITPRPCPRYPVGPSLRHRISPDCVTSAGAPEILMHFPRDMVVKA
jgi:hypothetical protein